MSKKRPEQKHEELTRKIEELPPKQTEMESLKEQLTVRDKEIEDIKNKYLRALADFDNYKKRANLERDDLVRFSNEILIKELLPTVDSFGKAIDLMQKSSTDDAIVKGIALINKQIEDVFIKFGVKQIDALNRPYDPNYHEAILTKVSDEQEGVVLEEVQKGYTLHERLLRPSMVIVSKKSNQ